MKIAMLLVVYDSNSMRLPSAQRNWDEMLKCCKGERSKTRTIYLAKTFLKNEERIEPRKMFPVSKMPTMKA